MNSQQIFTTSNATGTSGSIQYGALPSGQKIPFYMTFGAQETVGVTTLVAVSSVSLLAVLILFIATLVYACKSRGAMDKHAFVRANLAPYFLSLLVCDVIQALGSIMGARWVAEKGIIMGGFCTIQGTLKQAADIGAAFWTMVIAFNTFWILFYECKVHRYVTWGLIISGWSAICAIVIFGPAALNTNKFGPFYGLAGYWCWIGPQYSVERVLLAYLPMLSASAISFSLFFFIFLRLRGFLVVNGWRVKLDSRAEPTGAWRNQNQGEGQMIIMAKQMILFPVAYTILILPIACVRFTQLSGRNVAFASTIFSDAILMLSGLVHVALFVASRRILSDEALTVGDGQISRPRLAQAESFFCGPGSFVSIKSSSLSKPPPTPQIIISPADMPPPMIQRTPSFDVDMEKELSAMESYEVVGVLTAPKITPRRNRHSRKDSRRHSHLGSISIPTPEVVPKHPNRRVSYQVGNSDRVDHTVRSWAIDKAPPAGVPDDVVARSFDSAYDIYDERKSSMEEIKLSGPKEPQEVFVVLSPRLNGEDEVKTGFHV